MDAEKFDKVVLDLLYDELDELTRASAIRHTEQSGRAKALYSELRATREVGTLPLVEPPADLEERILAAEKLARAERPLRQRFGTLVSIAASYAMRPQMGMAALLMLMVGSSLLLLRVKPGAPSSVQVTERGVPETDKESVAVPVGPTPEPMALAPTETAHGAAHARQDSPKGDGVGPSALAKEAEDGIAMNGPERERAALPPDGPGAAPAAKSFGTLGGAPAAAAPFAAEDRFAPAPRAGGADNGAAKATRDMDDSASADDPSGCTDALPHYEAVMLHPSSPAAANAARFAAADCYARLGQLDRARRSYSALLGVPSYRERARNALSLLPDPTGSANAAPAPADPSGPAATASAAPSKPEP